MGQQTGKIQNCSSHFNGFFCFRIVCIFPIICQIKTLQIRSSHFNGFFHFGIVHIFPIIRQIEISKIFEHNINRLSAQNGNTHGVVIKNRIFLKLQRISKDVGNYQYSTKHPQCYLHVNGHKRTEQTEQTNGNFNISSIFGDKLSLLQSLLFSLWGH